ncbi:retrovirus-related pol polyprotein from transposon TNT 1-94, partial [Tanacetum coccineum]
MEKMPINQVFLDHVLLDQLYLTSSTFVGPSTWPSTRPSMGPSTGPSTGPATGLRGEGGRRHRLHPLEYYTITLYTNGKLRTRVTVMLISKAEVEYLNTMNFPGIPPYELELKVGSPIMLLKNVNILGGLCNGTRMIVRSLKSKVIEAQVISGRRVGDKINNLIFPFKDSPEMLETTIASLDVRQRNRVLEAKEPVRSLEDWEVSSLQCMQRIYETEKNKSLISATPLSIAFFSSSIFQDFQDIPNDEEDTRSSHEYLNDLEEEYQARALLAKSKDSSSK